MREDDSAKFCHLLIKKFHETKLHRPMRVERYDAGTRLSYNVIGLETSDQARLDLEVEAFVGGGFAGQVYRIRILDIQFSNKPLPGLEKDRVCAMKILLPPSGSSKFFRNLLYRIGFQGPFQLQVNPTAAREGALWQKFIRRGMGLRFGEENAVNDIHATFVDSSLGSCGEISDWVEGRTWRLEVDDRMDLLRLSLRGKSVEMSELGSPEYRSKKEFMAEFVRLLHDMGAHEFARQYEWSTCKSQPNCLKRYSTDDEPTKGLVAVDFRAGLTLLPFLPMSPGDFKLILQGLKRGSLVQFDRGNMERLEGFVRDHSESFSDMESMLQELKTCTQFYRNSVPDITHNFFKLFYSKTLWSTLFRSARLGWHVQGLTDEKADQRFKKSCFRTFVFYLLGGIPILGEFLRKLWAREDWRKHYRGLISSIGYLKRAFRGKCIECALSWFRAGRVEQEKAWEISESALKMMIHLPLSILPVSLHKFFTSWCYIKSRLHHLFVRPVKLYFSASLREEWLRDMIAEGQKKQIIDKKDAEVITSQLKDPFIQKYLKSLAVHVCTLPVTQVVSVLVSWLYVRLHPEMSTAQATVAVAAILVLFQLTPVSPGSLVRGLYVIYLVIRERNLRDYQIAVCLGFFKYIGYLAFPIQMTYRYPELARFMAVHWATEAVHIVPVFGEKGALLEHWVYCVFYNWPLTIRRRMKKISEIRTSLNPRYWHIAYYTIAALVVLILVDFLSVLTTGAVPTFKSIWWLVIGLPVICGARITLGCGGAFLLRRFASAIVWGVLTGILYSIFSKLFVPGGALTLNGVIVDAAWRAFIFAVFATIGAILTELFLPDPEIKSR